MAKDDWTHTACKKCYDTLYPGRIPHRMPAKWVKTEPCCFCRIPTSDGIYVRYNPNIHDNDENYETDTSNE